MSSVNLIERYFRAIESSDLPGMLACYDDSAIQIELPNRLKTAGDRRTVDDLRRDFERGSGLLQSQSYDIVSFLEEGNRVVVEVLWRGRLAVPVASLGAGEEMRAHSAIFFDLRDGRIVAQRNYDCFEVF
jgi:ketosteroid isomerase-like protein